jgi:hypothetical protein
MGALVESTLALVCGAGLSLRVLPGIASNWDGRIGFAGKSAPPELGEKAAGRATNIQLLWSWGKGGPLRYKHSAPPELGERRPVALQTFSSSGAGCGFGSKCYLSLRQVGHWNLF